MLQPKRTKFRKMFKGRIKGEAKGGSDLNFGTYGLKALQPERVTARQIEAARRAMTRHMKRQGRVWIRIFPDTPVTSKPTEVRMGKGKGSVDFWAAEIQSHPKRVMSQQPSHVLAPFFFSLFAFTILMVTMLYLRIKVLYLEDSRQNTF